MDEKNKLTNNIRYKKKEGITLIALLITIVVMLILVAITISVALNGGLFSYAGKAVGDTQNAIDKEQELAGGKVKVGNKVYNSIDDYLNGKEAETFSEIYTATTEYKENGVTTAWIPKGFAVGTSEGINKVDDGLVIQDEAGNQFVWIPVTVTGTTTAEKEASFDAIRTARDDTNIKEPTEDSQEEYEEMRASVIANGGFYIARYEAGCATGRISTDESVVITPLSKKGVYPYNMVRWLDAKTASQSMYNDNTKYGVKSTLCYGVEWDAMLGFLGKTNETDSTSWGNYFNAGPFSFTGKYYQQEWDEDWENIISEGWYSNTTTKPKDTDILLQTGAANRNSLKNIYDVVGNLLEMTMEGDSASGRFCRGGEYGPWSVGLGANVRLWIPFDQRHRRHKSAFELHFICRSVCH